MTTAGQVLKSRRLQKKLDLEEVARITRIRPQFLAAIEADDYQKLPSGTVAAGFIRNYCEFLGIPATQVLAVFRRDFVENLQGQVVPRGMVKPVSGGSFWTPATTLVAAVALVLTLFGGYLLYQYRILTGPPPLRLSEPVDSQVVKEPVVVVAGQTDPEATLSVNGQLVALEKGGQFFFRLPLKPGANALAVTAISKSGRTTTLTRSVTFR